MPKALMKTHRFARLWWSAACIGIAGCSSVPYSIETPTVEVESLTLMESTQAAQRYLVTLRLDNSNAVPVTLRGLEFQIRLAGEGFIEGSADGLISLAANGQSTIRSDVRSEFLSSVTRLMSYLQGPDSTVPYEIDGELALDTRPPRFIRFDGSGRTPLIIVARQ